MRAIKWGWSYISTYKWRLTFGLLVNCVNIVLMLINPLIAGLIVQNVIQEEQHDLLPTYLLIMIAVTAFRSVSRYFFVVLYEHTSQKILFNMRRDLYHKLHMQSFAWFDKNRVGDIMSRMTGDLEAVRHFIAFVSYMVIEHVLLYIAAVIVMATISPPLTLAMLLTTPLLIYASVKQSRGVRPAFRNVREQFANLNSTCGENIGGNRVVKAFTRESHETEKFIDVNNAFYSANMDAAAVRVKYFPIMETCAALLPWLLILVGGLLTIYGHLELWQLVAFGGYLWMLDAPTRIFTWAVNDIQNAATSIDKVYEMMRQPILIESPLKDKGLGDEARLAPDACASSPPPGEQPAPDDIEDAPFAVEFKNVFFNYTPYQTSEYILKNITFRAKKGQTIGIVGGTGSGKSTLVNLIARFYDTCKGEVCVNGANVREYDLPTLRNGISYVMQDVFLYSDTVEGNIAFGVPDAPVEEVYTAAKIADADNFIREMPESYDTIVGERGVGLSGGQKQRISLARAIATNPEILILDDVTSAVDTETEHRIQTALGEMKKRAKRAVGTGDTCGRQHIPSKPEAVSHSVKNAAERTTGTGDTCGRQHIPSKPEAVSHSAKNAAERTTFIVAHRLSSVRDADLILVLVAGEISERGTHDELMKKNGYYANLYREQTKR